MVFKKVGVRYLIFIVNKIILKPIELMKLLVMKKMMFAMAMDLTTNTGSNPYTRRLVESR